MAAAKKKAPLDPARILALETEASKTLLANIKLIAGDDEDAVRDTFEGETKLDDAIRRVLLANDEDQILIDGIKARESDLKERRGRAEKRIESRRDLILQAMLMAEWDRQTFDIATVSVGTAAKKLEIDEESKIPSRFWKPSDPTLDRKAVTDTLKQVDGALAEAKELTDDGARAAALLDIAQRMFEPTDDLGSALRSVSACNAPEERAQMAGELVSRFRPLPGAMLVDGGRSLSIRRK